MNCAFPHLFLYEAEFALEQCVSDAQRAGEGYDL